MNEGRPPACNPGSPLATKQATGLLEIDEMLDRFDSTLERLDKSAAALRDVVKDPVPCVPPEVGAANVATQGELGGRLMRLGRLLDTLGEIDAVLRRDVAVFCGKDVSMSNLADIQGIPPGVSSPGCSRI